ncbi:MAG: hypothetical protein U0Q16_14595 [Bryobacteraceae bacterium]
MTIAEKVETILLIAADAREFEGLAQHLRPLEKLAWPLAYARRGALRGKPCVLVADGPGPKLARRAVEEAARRTHVARVVSTGLAGALDPALRVNDIFIPGRIVDVETQAIYRTADDNSATLASGDRVLQTPAEKSFLRDLTGASAVDMEAAAVAAVAEERGWPMRCIRVISDTAFEGFRIDLNAARDTQGRFRTGKIVLSALKQPKQGLPELWNLNQRSKEGSQRLGDYLVDCDL